ncbi:MAG: hypothetical protein ABMA02_16730, partial [Saprospiraceae bacterium]
CCVAFFSPLHAQYDDLLRKGRYPWVAEYTTDYELNPIYSEKVNTEMNLVHTIRLESANQKHGLFQELELKHYLSHTLLQGLASGAFACFADEQLSQPLSREKVLNLLSWPETIINFDHFDTVTVLREILPSEIDLFRIRQVFFFDSRKKQFGSRLLALAPMVDKTDAEGNFTRRLPLLWIKIHPDNHRETQKIAKNATYAAQTFMGGNAPQVEDMKTVNGSLDLKKWASAEVRKPTHQVLASDDFSSLNVDALEGKVFTTDTLIVYDPETYEESAAIVRNNAIDRVEKIRFVQNWYYDERRHRLAVQVVAAAPIAAVRDSEGEIRYYKPLFYSKY